MHTTPIRIAAFAFLTLILSACFAHGEEHDIRYQNETQMAVTIRSDGDDLAILRPGQSIEISQRRRNLPDHVEAFDEDWNLVFDQDYDWSDLEALNFTVTIR